MASPEWKNCQSEASPVKWVFAYGAGTQNLMVLLLSPVAIFLAQTILPPYKSFRPWHTKRAAAFQFSHFTVANRKYHASFGRPNWHENAKVCGRVSYWRKKRTLQERLFPTTWHEPALSFSLCFSAELLGYLEPQSVLWIIYLYSLARYFFGMRFFLFFFFYK